MLLSTWSFGRSANAVAWPILAGGGAALDAAEAAARHAEADEQNRTVGRGGLPDRSGRVSLDAAVMLAPARCGAVACVRQHLHAVTIARAVMERTSHILLVGDDADRFADEIGLPRADLLTEAAGARWRQWRDGPASAAPQANVEERSSADAEASDPNASHDTIAILALDASGAMAGACTTSGLAWKLPGRVGDSPIVGHGLYVDPRAGAAVATGHGERVMGVCGSFLAVEHLRRGAGPLEAAIAVLRRMAEAYDLRDRDQAGLIVLAADGRWAGASLRPGFHVAVRTRRRDDLVEPGFTLLPGRLHE